jgi:hypothetical protein
VDLRVHHLPECRHDLVAVDHQKRFPSEPGRAKLPVFLQCSDRRGASPGRLAMADGVGSG